MNRYSSPIDDDRLSAYIDNEMSPEERSDFERLLDSDANYRQAVNELRALGEALRALPVPASPPDLSDSIVRQAERLWFTGGTEVQPAATLGTRGPATAARRTATVPSPRRPAGGLPRWAFMAVAATAAAGLFLWALPWLVPRRQVADLPSPHTASSPPAAGAAPQAPGSIPSPYEMRSGDERNEHADALFVEENFVRRSPDVATVREKAGSSAESAPPAAAAPHDSVPAAPLGDRPDLLADQGLAAGASGAPAPESGARGATAEWPRPEQPAPEGAAMAKQASEEPPFDAVAEIELAGDMNVENFVQTLVRNQIAMSDSDGRSSEDPETETAEWQAGASPPSQRGMGLSAPADPTSTPQAYVVEAPVADMQAVFFDLTQQSVRWRMDARSLALQEELQETPRDNVLDGFQGGSREGSARTQTRGRASEPVESVESVESVAGGREAVPRAENAALGRGRAFPYPGGQLPPTQSASGFGGLGQRRFPARELPADPDRAAGEDAVRVLFFLLPSSQEGTIPQER